MLAINSAMGGEEVARSRCGADDGGRGESGQLIIGVS